MNTEFEELLEDITIPAIAEESSNVSYSAPPPVKLISAKLPSGIEDSLRDKLSRYSDVLGLTGDKLEVRNIDFKIASEMFAMLPEYIDKLEQSKLTRLPSEANNNLVNTLVIKNIPIIEAEIISELQEKYNELFSIYSSSIKKHIDEILTAFNAFKELNTDKLLKIQNTLHIAISNKSSIDLKTSPLTTLKEFDLKNIDNSKLNTCFNTVFYKLIDNENFANLLYLLRASYSVNRFKEVRFETITLSDVLNLLQKFSDGEMQTHIAGKLIANMEYMANISIQSTGIDKVRFLKDISRDIEEIIEYFVSISKMHEEIHKKDNILSTLQELIDLLEVVS